MIRVVVVEDEWIIRRGIVKIIQENVSEIQVVGDFSNGQECLDFLKGSQCDLIISDIRMPQMGGLEMIRHLRNENVPVDFVLLSGYDDFEYCREAIQNGVIDYILKPLDKQDFISTLKKYVSAHCKETGSCEETAAEDEQHMVADRRIIRDIKQYLKDHYEEKVSLKSLSDHFYMNPNYICQLFKLETGQTLTTYVAEVRMKKAGEHLLDPTKRVGEIAVMVGYQSTKSFSAVFKKYYGMTPGEYRKNAYGDEESADGSV